MLKLLSAALAALAMAGTAEAQQWPAKPVTIIVPFSAGGTADIFGRMLANGLQQKYGTTFIVENRPGAGGNIGATAVSRAPKDGYTFLVGTVSTHAINPFVYKSMPHDTEKDFQPVSLIARLPNVLVVSNKLPVKTVPESHRPPEGQCGQAELRLVRRRHIDPSGSRVVPDQDRHQDGARAVSFVRRDHERAGRRTHRSRLR